MHRLTKSVAIVFAAALALAPALSAERFLLRLGLADGARTVHTWSQETESSVDLGAMGTQQIGMTMEARFSQEYSRTDGGYAVATRFADVEMALEAPGMNMTMSADGDDETATMLRTLEETTMTMDVTDQGRVTGVRDLDTILEKLTEGQGQAAAQMTNQLKGMFNSDGITPMSNMMVVFPDRAVALGETWTHASNSELPGIGAFDLRVDYSVQARETHADRDCVKIAMVGTMDLDLEGLTETMKQQFGGMEPEVEVETVRFNGEGWVELATGVVVDLEMVQQMDMSIRVPMPNDPEQTMTMGMEMQQTYRMLLAEGP